MAVANIVQDRQEILDKLEELPLKGFSEGEETPSTGTASLPTPDGWNTTFTYVVPGVDYPYLRNDGWYSEQPKELYQPENEQSHQPPGAPLMKDLDSFTDGTGQGSFDSLPPAATDQHGQPIHTVDTLSLCLLPPPDALPAAVESWREKVSTSIPSERVAHVKRRRSPTPEGERRTRPRSLSLGSACTRPPCPRRFPRRSSSLPRRLPPVLECEQPD